MSNQTNIGLNPLTSSKPLWFAGPDVVASMLLSGKPPRILRAIRFEPIGKQKGMKSVKLGKGSINPARDDFARKVIEERKGKDKSDPLYYFLKILANAGCYGIYAEVNRQQTGKNDAKQIGIFSGEDSRTERTCVVEPPGPWYFPPVSAQITAGGRLLWAVLEKMVTDAGGTYLMCDTDSMAIVASESGGLVPCIGGPHKMPDGRDAIQALSWAAAREIANKFKSLNPYNKKIVPGSVLNIVGNSITTQPGNSVSFTVTAFPRNVTIFMPSTVHRSELSSPANTDWECTSDQRRVAIRNVRCRCGLRKAGSGSYTVHWEFRAMNRKWFGLPIIEEDRYQYAKCDGCAAQARPRSGAPV